MKNRGVYVYKNAILVHPVDVCLFHFQSRVSVAEPYRWFTPFD